ncbi:MAG: hypothetical protein E7166_03800 [Firmicutes bacterium]|nr:hypothetical protein [Bacillota bacterium]
MENKIIDRFKNKIKLKVSGKNIERFIKRLYKNDIEIISLKYIDFKTIIITTYLEDYEKIEKFKSIYKITKLGYGGLIKVKRKLFINRFLILFLVIGYMFILFLSNIIFEVQVVHTSVDIRNLVIKELNKYNIKKYNIKKNFEELNKISNKILENNKDKIEWISIENIGTKVKVKVEERKLNLEVEEYPIQNIVATKSGIIKKITAKNGVVVKNINDYVTKGDIIISGVITDTYGEKILDKVSANGSVFAEVWYTVDLEYPIIYTKDTKTGNKKTMYEIEFLNKRIPLFTKSYKHSIDNSKIILKNPLIPFGILKTQKQEITKEDNVYLPEEALEKAIKLARNKIESRLDKNEYIIKEKKLSFYQKDSKIVVEMFFSVLENIGKPSEIIDEVKTEEKGSINND